MTLAITHPTYIGTNMANNDSYRVEYIDPSGQKHIIFSDLNASQVKKAALDYLQKDLLFDYKWYGYGDEIEGQFSKPGLIGSQIMPWQVNILKNKLGNPDDYEPPLDPGIEAYVRILNHFGIETFESCEGGEGHAFNEPTVKFHGGIPEGYKAYGIALEHKFPVSRLCRTWNPNEYGELVGPVWEIIFYRKARVGEYDNVILHYNKLKGVVSDVAQ